jgi:glycosyltransferase involved in cell wall biosynthesis
MPEVSVVITCFSEGTLLLRAVDSLRNQSLQGFEIIIVNDSSTDSETNKICKNLEQAGLVTYSTPFNMGPSGARNLGISKANGEIIIPLDADDTLPPDSVESVAACFGNHPECDFVYGNYNRIDLPENKCSIINCAQITGENKEINPRGLMNNWILLGMTPHRRGIWEKVRGYSMVYSYTCQDVDFQMRSYMAGARFHYLNKVIYEYYRSPTGVNSSERNQAALIQCWYDNIDFIIEYSNDFKDGLSLALMHKDYRKIKYWANHEAHEKRWTVLVSIFYISPLFLYCLVVPLYSGVKNLLKKGRTSNYIQR